MASNALRDLRTAVVAFVALSALLGLAYPLAITGAAQALFRSQANGSIVSVDGRPVGSSLVGQNFSDPKYFHPRPSAAGADGYDAAASGGSNLGPTSRTLAARVAAGVAKVRAEDGLPAGAKVPVDAVTASGSGLDPHISPAYAELQVPRVAAARGMTSAAVRALVEKYTDGSTLEVLGEPRVNVLLVNIALDAAQAGARAAPEAGR